MDELLLTKAEEGRGGEVLRLWESCEYFVVLGRAGKLLDECFDGKCAEDGIKIIRRVSGGGTVLQGPGCVNFSLILSYGRDEKYGDIMSSYGAILGRIAGGFSAKGVKLEYMPISDLALSGNKVSGNAQARKKSFFLHHGTFLSSFDTDKVKRYLKHPPKEPAYRKGRGHDNFMGDIGIPVSEVKEILMKTFEADIPSGFDDTDAKLRTLATKKYTSDEWNRMF
ncbi:MAG: lipoate--protein ligase family protein [Candidatus Omnitrophica bacterium]|nr:lipoate--protein ligase family protein [Candidatus Omnitrophota bacterium]